MTPHKDGLPAVDDWQHLKPYGYAPGNYMSRCRDCNDTPIMDKRAFRCRPCAEAAHAKALAAKPLPAQEEAELFSERVANGVCRDVGELPDRSSPEDWPEAMLVTHDELKEIVMSNFVRLSKSTDYGKPYESVAHAAKKAAEELAPAFAALAAQPASPERKPLTDEQISKGCNYAIELSNEIERAAFRKGVKFAEDAHRISATQEPRT